MKNSIEIFDQSITDLDVNTTYVTDEAINYLHEIDFELGMIADDLVTLATGAVDVLTPASAGLEFELYNRIDNFKNFFAMAQKNDRNSANKILDRKDVLIKFDNLKILLSQPKKNFRQTALRLFTKTGPFYSTAEMQEFVSLLNKDELNCIIQIIHQEKTLLPEQKKITNSPIPSLVVKRLKEMNSPQISSTINRSQIPSKGKEYLGEER